MTQALVQSLVMHALATPAFLRQLKEDGAVPGLAGDRQVVAAALDAHRLYLFGGFLTRVQNNPLRSLIPCTLELLARLDLEIAAFAAYRERFVALRAQGPLAAAERLDAFESFLGDFIAEYQGDLIAGNPWQDLIRASLRHERIIVELAGGAVAECPPPGPGGPQAIPVILGRLHLEDFSCDPAGLARLLHADAAVPAGASLDALHRPTSMLYWRRDGDTLPLAVAVDSLSAALLRAIDGRRSVTAIAAAAAIESAVVTAFFDTVVQQGLVVLTNPDALS